MKKLLLISLLAFNTVANAQKWIELRSGSSALNADYGIWSICSDPTGNVYAAGEFRNVNAKRYVAKWDDSSWIELGMGGNELNANAIIRTICSDGIGNIYAAGDFRNANGKCYVAKWDGKHWIELGSGNNALNANYGIASIIVDAKGNLFAAGGFSNSNKKNYVAKWDGITWIELGSGSNLFGVSQTIQSICCDSAANIYAGGSFKNSNGKGFVAKWDGTAWTELGGSSYPATTSSKTQALCSDVRGNIYAKFDSYVNTLIKLYIAKWDGATWILLENGNNPLEPYNQIAGLCSDLSGNIYTTFGNDSLGKVLIAQWDGTSWNELGNINIWPGAVAVCTDMVGNVFAGGNFRDSNNKRYVTKYDRDSTAISIPISTCHSYTFNGRILTSSGMYLDTFTSIGGSDSTVILKLHIKAVSVAVKQSKNTLTAIDSGATYQWLDCKKGYLPISGATNQSYTATLNGDYAVIVTRDSCTDTSSCYSVSNLEIGVLNSQSQPIITPNPTNSTFTIQHSSLQKEELCIYTVLGELVFKDSWLPAQTSKTMDVAHLAKGIYIVKLGGTVQRVVVQ